MFSTGRSRMLYLCCSITLLIGSTGKTIVADGQVPSDSSTPSIATQAIHHVSDPPADGSLTAEQYVEAGLATVVAGCLQTLTERNTYRASELKRLIGYLNKTLPGILPQLPEGCRQETSVRLSQLEADPNMEDLKAEISGLRETAAKAVEGLEASPQ